MLQLLDHTFHNGGDIAETGGIRGKYIVFR
jgi:hypothetical protein